MIGNNLILTKDEYDKEFLTVKKQLKEISGEIKTIKQLNERIINEIGNFARKSELDILKRQFIHLKKPTGHFLFLKEF